MLTDLTMEPIWNSPEFVLEKLLNKHSLRKFQGKRIEGSENLRLFLNELYKQSEREIHQLLSSREPAAWIRVAMEQLARWTVIYLDNKVDGERKNDEVAALSLAPVGRYGWRYVIDVSLRNVTSSSKVFRGIPEEDDILQAFSLITIMNLSSEWSNFFHYFGKEFPFFYAETEPLSSILMPQLMPEHDEEFQRRVGYVQQSPDWRNLNDVYPSITEGKYAQILDAALQPNVGFSICDFHKFLKALIEITCPYIPIVIVHSRNYLSELISYISGMSISKVNSIIDFAFLSKDKLSDTSRDFLKRSDMARMLNFAGIVLPRIRHLDALYDLSSVPSTVLTDNEHVIISVPMLAEWIDYLSWSLIHGLRTDLKKINWLRPALNQLEEYYRRQIFEGSLAALYGEMGYEYIWGLKETSTGRLLPCGEIDLLAYDPLTNTLDIVEAKAVAGATTFRGWHQAYQDHFNQKKYHQKFISKINWVQGSTEIVRHEFKQKCGVEMQPNFSVHAKFVTKSPSIVKFYVSEYEVLTYEELRSSFQKPQSPA